MFSPAQKDAGLPDGLFNTKNTNFYTLWKTLGRVECAGMILSICDIFIHLVYFKVTEYVLWSFGIFFPVLVCCTEKNLALLVRCDC
jgi:hypothetical protein